MARRAARRSIALAWTVVAMAGAAVHGGPLVAPGVAAAAVAMEDTAAVATRLAERRLLVPVVGVMPHELRDTFSASRGGNSHEAIDIPARRGEQTSPRDKAFG